MGKPTLLRSSGFPLINSAYEFTKIPKHTQQKPCYIEESMETTNRFKTRKALDTGNTTQTCGIAM